MRYETRTVIFSLLHVFYFFFFNDTATTEIYTLSLHDALPISGVGVVVVNLNKREIRDTYHPSSSEEEFLDIAFYQDSIYVLTASNIYVSSADNSFLADPGQWNVLQNIADYTAFGAYENIEVFNNELFLSYNDDAYEVDTLFKLVNNSPEVFLDNIEIR